MNKDWLYIQTATSELEEYLQSQVLHWPLSPKISDWDGGAFPRLTIGNLCLARKRLAVFHGDVPPQLYESFVESIEFKRNRWRVNWGRKADAEFKERLRLWQAFIQEELVIERSTSDYRNQVQQRVLLELLLDEIFAEDLERIILLQDLDQQIHQLTSPGNFIWDLQYRPGFPQDKFWFLYRR